MDRSLDTLVSSTRLRVFTILQGVVVTTVNVFVAKGLKKAAECARLCTAHHTLALYRRTPLVLLPLCHFTALESRARHQRG